MKLFDILADVPVLRSSADGQTEITGITNDSREVRAGFLFVAVRGFATDGHKFIESARKNGAAAVVVEEAAGDGPEIVVADSRRELSRLAANFYGHPSREMTVVGVTGTNGKTTVTYLVLDILRKLAGAKTGLIGTNEVRIGDDAREAGRTTPESHEIQAYFRQMRDAGVTHAVMEVSSHALTLHRVADIKYDYGVFTNLTQDHLDFHPTMEDYLDAKAALFRMCGKGIINLDDPWAEKLAEKASCPLSTYSIDNPKADLIAKNVKLKADRVEFEALGWGEIYRMELGIPGRFSVYNALAAAAVGRELGLSLPELSDVLRASGGVKGRCEVVPTGEPYTAIIDYAHTPDALENILKTAKGFAKGRVVAVFGCGGDRDRSKRKIMGKIAEECADFCVVTSDNPRTEDPEAIIADILEGMEKKRKRTVIADRTEAMHYALSHAEGGDVIVFAGKGHETYQEINGVKHHMDEREIIRDYLKKRQETSKKM